MSQYVNSHNPILPLEHHVPDSEAHVFSDGRLYVFGSYDAFAEAYCSDCYRVFSTADMKSWTDHGVSFRGQDVPWFNDPNAPKYAGLDFTKPSPFLLKMMGGHKPPEGEEPAPEQFQRPTIPFLYAPDAIEKNGKYFLFFCMTDQSEGVAVADRPEGPYGSPVQLPCGGIDPAIFIDDDGQAYFYWGQIWSKGVKLDPSLTSFDPKDIVENLVTEEEHFFHEGSSMRRIGDTYYYVFADMERGKPTSLGYATSKSPLGPFEYKGIIVDNDGCDPASWNNHGSIECLNGQWYVFYHRCSRNTQYYRRLCIEPITINPDGTIDEVKMTSQGPGAPFGPGEPLMGWQACSLSGRVYIDADEKHIESLQHIAAGDSAVFRYVRSDRPYTKATLRCEGKGEVRVLLNGVCAGQAVIDGSAEAYEAPLLAAAGEYELQLAFDASDGLKLISVTLE